MHKDIYFSRKGEGYVNVFNPAEPHSAGVVGKGKKFKNRPVI